MDDEVEFSGKTVEDAIRQAERDLHGSRDELEVTVITTGSRGVFGIGAEQARVRARRSTVQADSASALPDESTDYSHPVGDDFQETGAATRLEVDEVAGGEEFYAHEGDDVDQYDEEDTGELPAVSAAAAQDLAEQAGEVLRELLDVMGFDAQVTIRTVENPIMLAVTGDNLGVLIGRRGDNLAALQFMVNLILSKNRRQWPRVVVDVENYRERREESLRSLADRIAERVRRNGKAFTLEAMPAGDRRIIHLTLRDARDVETYSIGEGPARRVVIAPKRISRGETSRASS